MSTSRYLRIKYKFITPAKIQGSIFTAMTIVGSIFKYRNNAVNGTTQRSTKPENIQGYFNFAVACTEFTIGLVKPIINDCIIITLANPGVKSG